MIIHRSDKNSCKTRCGVKFPKNTTYLPELVTCPRCRGAEGQKKKVIMTPLEVLALDILKNDRKVTWEEAKEVLYPLKENS